MKIKDALILSLAFPLMVVFANSCGAETVVVNKDFNGREIKVRPGATIQVELEQAGATGFSWELQRLDAEHFEKLSVDIIGKPADAGEMVGAPVGKKWLIRATKDGKSKLVFLYFRPWEGEKSAEKTFVLNVRILKSR